MSVQQTAATSSPSKRPVNFFVCLTAATAALAGLLFGFDTGVISGAILFIKGDFGLTPFTEELLVSGSAGGGLRRSSERKNHRRAWTQAHTLWHGMPFCRRVDSMCRSVIHLSELAA